MILIQMAGQWKDLVELIIRPAVQQVEEYWGVLINMQL
jgi:hypothetical protein